MYVQNPMAIHPIGVDIQAISLDKKWWTFPSLEPCQASIAEQNSRIKAEQIFLNDPFLSLVGTCPTSSSHPWPSVAFH